MPDTVNAILREIQQQLQDALANAQRDRELLASRLRGTNRAVQPVDLDMVAADIRTILGVATRSANDIASIDIKLAVLPEIEATLRSLKAECR